MGALAVTVSLPLLQSLVDVNPRSTAAAVNAQLRAMMPDLLEAGEWRPLWSHFLLSRDSGSRQ